MSDKAVYIEAAKKAWRTRRAKIIQELRSSHKLLTEYSVSDVEIRVPPDVRFGSYKIGVPLIRPSKLTAKEYGGVGKELSEGWAINYAIGCTHGCIFCYVDSYVKRSWARYGEVAREKWGHYLLIPENIDEAIEATPWLKWRGKEVLMSSMHDPYLPQLTKITRKILEKALPRGVRFTIQTRSTLVLRDFDLIEKYKDQVRIQVSIATLDPEFARLIEARVPPPEKRLDIIRKAKEIGVKTGVLVAPVFPPIKIRSDPVSDLKKIFEVLAEIRPDVVYGECLHIRGLNKRYIKEILGETVYYSPKFDENMKILFEHMLKKYGLKGKWWMEHRKKQYD